MRHRIDSVYKMVQALTILSALQLFSDGPSVIVEGSASGEPYGINLGLVEGAARAGAALDPHHKGSPSSQPQKPEMPICSRVAGSDRQAGMVNGVLRFERLLDIQRVPSSSDLDVIRLKEIPSEVLFKCQSQCLKDETANGVRQHACGSLDFVPGKRFSTYSPSIEFTESKCFLAAPDERPGQPPKYEKKMDYYHYRKVCFTGNASEKSAAETDCPERLYVMERQMGHAFKPKGSREVKASSLEECQSLCLNQLSSEGALKTTTLCRGGSFDHLWKRCYLSEYTRRTHPFEFVPNQDYDYFENTCLDVERRCPKNKLFWTKEVNSEMTGPYDSLIFPNMTLETCKEKCLSQRNIYCRSLEYDEGSKICVLSDEDSISKPEHIKQSASVQNVYLELTCIDGYEVETQNLFSDGDTQTGQDRQHLSTRNSNSIKTAFQIYRNRHLETNTGYNGRVIEGAVATLALCLDYCLVEKSFPCRSAMYSKLKQMCRIMEMDTLNGNLAYSADVDYYENLLRDGSRGGSVSSSRGSSNQFFGSSNTNNFGNRFENFDNTGRFNSFRGSNSGSSRFDSGSNLIGSGASQAGFRNNFNHGTVLSRNRGSSRFSGTTGSFGSSGSSFKDTSVATNTLKSGDRFSGVFDPFKIKNFQGDRRVGTGIDSGSQGSRDFDSFGNRLDNRNTGNNFFNNRRQNFGGISSGAASTFDRTRNQGSGLNSGGSLFHGLRQNERRPSSGFNAFQTRDHSRPFGPFGQSTSGLDGSSLHSGFGGFGGRPFGQGSLGSGGDSGFGNANRFFQSGTSAFTGTGTISDAVAEVSQQCNPDGSMEFMFRTRDPFRGRIYTIGHYDRCLFRGGGSQVNMLKITSPGGFPDCGTGQYGDTSTNIVVVQFNDGIVTSNDKHYNLTCTTVGPGDAMVTSAHIGAGMGRPIAIQYLPEESRLDANVRLQILYSGRPTTTVAVGDPLTFRIESLRGPNFVSDIFATDVSAKDPLTGRSIRLIDSRGCPIEPAVFPALGKARTVEGLENRFPAFKIPQANMIIFEAKVRMCRVACSPAVCSGHGREPIYSYGKRRRRRSTDDPNTNNSMTSYSENGTLSDYDLTSMENITDSEIYYDYEDYYGLNENLSDDDQFARSLDDDGNFDGETANVNEVIRVYLNEEEAELHRDPTSQSSPLVGGGVCIQNSEYYSLVIALAITLACLAASLFAMGLYYRRNHKITTKNSEADAYNPNQTGLRSIFPGSHPRTVNQPARITGTLI